MGHPIIFKTKFVNFSDGRIMHLSLQGCNNDAEGRNNDDWQANIYTKTEFMMWAEHFKRDSEPYKKSGAFELKIGSRICSLYDYGTHLLRMYKKAVSFEDFKRNNYVTFHRLDGVTVYEGITENQMTMQEFNDYASKHLRLGGMHYRLNYTRLDTENEVIAALDNGSRLRIYIGK